jgi:hypothetical protein
MRKRSSPRVLLWLLIQQPSDAEEERGLGACEGRSVGAPQRAGLVQSSLEFQVTITNAEETTYRSRNLVSAHY